MAVICNTCGLPEDLCACGELAKDSTKIIIRLETRRFKKKGTMIEGLDPKLNNLETVAKDLRDTIKETLVHLGFAEDTIELH
jgi:translation initiation factor 1